MCTLELGNLDGVEGRGHLRILPTLMSDLFFFKLSCIFTKLHMIFWGLCLHFCFVFLCGFFLVSKLYFEFFLLTNIRCL